MAAKIRITNGNNVVAKVTDEQELLVTQSPYPPKEVQKVRPFRQYLTTDGTPTGTVEMGTDGSVTPVDYYVAAASGVDRYITSLSVLVGYAATGKPFHWADGAALANGFRLFYQSDQGEVELHEGIKSNQDLFRLSKASYLPNQWEVRHVNALNDYGYIMDIDLTEKLPALGVKLADDTRQRLVLCVQDNATSAVTFNIIAYGFDRF